MTSEMRAALVHAILRNAHVYVWTVQGFGFIRTKLDDVGRIHVWSDALRVFNVSDIHSHPWPLESTIISGELINQRYLRPKADSAARPLLMHSCKIQTGEQGGLVGDKADAILSPLSPEGYTRRMSYGQEPSEIHRTNAASGTVTLLARPKGPPDEVAEVFWPQGTAWISAEPRPASNREVEEVIGYALQRWNP